MGIYVPFIKKPVGCAACPFEPGMLPCHYTSVFKDCPIIEIGPHGRLVDADKLEDFVGYDPESGEEGLPVAALYSAETVIPEEKDGGL